MGFAISQKTLGILAAFGLALVIAIFFSHKTLIIPPTSPANPVTVYVLDYGLHGSLILPTDNNTFIEYAYGDWRYFALNQQSLRDGLAALLVPTQGALGRRQFSSVEQIKQQADQGINLLPFAVAGTQASKLLNALNTRFEANLSTLVENPEIGLTLVHDSQDYMLFYNCNHALADWLRELGCQIRGWVTWSDFQVASDRPQPQTQAP